MADRKRWNPTKRRAGFQKTRTHGNTGRVPAPKAADHSSDKENASSSTSLSPTRSSCSVRSVTRPTSRRALSALHISCRDAELAVRLRSEHYERLFRNERRKCNRAAEKNKDLQKTISDLTTELAQVKNTSSAFAQNLRYQLEVNTAELFALQQSLEKSRDRNEELTRSRAALAKKVARLPARIESGAAKLAFKSLKEHGVISSEIRGCVRDLVALGAPLEGVSKMIHAVAKGLNIKITDTISARSAGRIVLEGGVAANLQIVHNIKNADHFTVGGDGTTHRNLNYESRFITVDEKMLAVGITQAPNHTSEEQLRGWQALIEEMYEVYNASPLGQRNPQDLRTFFVKITGMMTDHANDQKKLRDLFEQLKQRMERELRGERALLRLSSPELLTAIHKLTEEKIMAAGGIAAWDALPAEDRVARSNNLHAELCQKFGQAEFDALPQDVKDSVDFWLGGGCCMHKDLNAHKGGVDSMASSWIKNGFIQPVLLMNKDNDAAAGSGSTAAKARAEKLSGRGGVKLTELMGMLLNHKDDKRGLQDSHAIFFDAHEHIGYSIKFPDTSNTRYGCYSDGAAEIITHLPVYRELMEFMRDRKTSLAFNHMEHNIWKAINDVPTIIELVVLLWYGQNFSHPVMRAVRLNNGGLQNLWDMGPVLQGVIDHCRRVIADPEIICGPNLSHTTATMDGEMWDRPEAMYAAHALLPTLPMDQVCAALVAFLEGAVVTWERFSEDVLGRELTAAQKRAARMPATNDANEGFLGQVVRVGKRRAPNATLDYLNAKAQYKANGTAEFILDELATPAGQSFLMEVARRIGTEGREKKRKVIQADSDKKKVADHRAKQKASREKKIAELKLINNCRVIFQISRFQDATSIKEIKVVEMDLQLRWHRLREMETDKKTEVPAPSTLKNKAAKAAALVAALERWLPRVRAGEVKLRGLSDAEPKFVEETAVEAPIESDEEEEEVGYGAED
ncbi:hypothetical protein B0H13DRAFT_1617392 [Mycena leptocephala]|nr:hypothetical protein B0H13DRAFT_1617392 [Mycena leptocephala]